MSFVTTPIASSSPSARQSAATSELLPEPTGPPIPRRSARSGGKEPPLAPRVGERAELAAGRKTAGQGGHVGGEPLDLRPRLDEPARGLGAVDRQEAHGGSRHHRRVLVEIRIRRLA